jgi:hypothetical protein
VDRHDKISRGSDLNFFAARQRESARLLTTQAQPQEVPRSIAETDRTNDSASPMAATIQILEDDHEVV